MAGNTRGKLKEQLEGIHTNYDWVIKHIDQSLLLIREYKPELAKALKSLAKVTKELDNLLQDIYAKV